MLREALIGMYRINKGNGDRKWLKSFYEGGEWEMMNELNISWYSKTRKKWSRWQISLSDLNFALDGLRELKRDGFFTLIYIDPLVLKWIDWPPWQENIKCI